MATKYFKRYKGLTLVEVMISVLILSVAVIGAAGYRYYAALDARKAAVEITAARIALLLCESWRGVKGAETYDPTAHLGSDLKIAESTQSEFGFDHALFYPTVSKHFKPLGFYRIVSNDVEYSTILLWKDISTGLRALDVVVAWPLWGQREPSYSDTTSGSSTDAYKSFELTTYTTTD